MKNIIRNERKLYFKDKKNYFISRLTKEHNYYVWKFVYLLRKEEQHNNKILKYWYRRRKNCLGAKLGIFINGGVAKEGLHIWHYGTVIINGYAKIGKNCNLHGQNCIGNSGSSESGISAPVIGNNVDVGVGASIIGDIFIADDIKIGAGAVVTKSCYEKGVTLVGIPAHVLQHKDGGKTSE